MLFRSSGLTLSVEATQTNDAPQGDLFDQGFQTGAAGEAAVARLVDDETGVAVQLVTSAHALPERRAQWRSLETGEVTRALRDLAVATTSITTSITTSTTTSAATPQTEQDPIGEPLALRLLASPRRVIVTTRRRRGFAVPVRYRERLSDGVRARNGMPLMDVLTAAGPDNMSVGQESGAAVVREYWQCLNGDGQLVLLFRDATPPATPTTAATTAATPTATTRPIAAVVAGNTTDSKESLWYLHGWWD